MKCMFESTNTPLQDTINRLDQCQDLLIEIEDLSKQKKEHIKRLAVCEGTVEERRSMVESFNNDRATKTAEKAVKSLQASLKVHKNLVRRHLRNLKELKLVYRELILGLLDKADPGWLHHRRKTALAAFHLAKDIHILLMRKSGDLCLRGGKKQRRPVKVYRPETLNVSRLFLHSKRRL